MLVVGDNSLLMICALSDVSECPSRTLSLLGAAAGFITPKRKKRCAVLTAHIG